MAKGKTFVNIHRKSRCFCDEELKGIVVVKALFANVFTIKAHCWAFQVSVPSGSVSESEA